jgi:hypothetical protein
VFGMLLDAGGGEARPAAWAAAFGSLAAISLLGAAAVGRSGKSA